MKNEHRCRYRCPYCAQRTITLYEKMGGNIPRWTNEYLITRLYCTNCQQYCSKLLGFSGAWGCVVLCCCLMVSLFAAAFLAFWGQDKAALCLVGGTLVLSALLCLLFLRFDKRTATEREADARLTFAVTAEGARVKKWEIYLLRFPKRGTNAHSPVIYAMVCGKSGKKGERVLTLRVIRADNMDLPDVGEPVLLVTRTNKVVEGTVTAAVPKKEVYIPDED